MREAFVDDYRDLRSLAANYLRRESCSPTLQATALVHEAYLRLAIGDREYADRAHFLCTAATVMRQILVDRARARHRIKRGGKMLRVTLDAVALHGCRELDVLILNEALNRLSEWDARQAQIVELRFFMGLRTEEIAELLDISVRTVKRDWSMARAWLQRELTPETDS